MTDKRVSAEKLVEVVDQCRMAGALDVGVATESERAEMKRLLVRHVVPVITMIVGVAGVFGASAMNQPVEPFARKARQEVRFAVEQKTTEET